jgi:hypothetical protein
MENLGMTDKTLFAVSVFLVGLGAGIALVAFVAPRSGSAGKLIGCKSEGDPRQAKAEALSQ